MVSSNKHHERKTRCSLFMRSWLFFSLILSFLSTAASSPSSSSLFAAEALGLQASLAVISLVSLPKVTAAAATATATADSKPPSSNEMDDPSSSSCERLKASLVYSQDNAPRDISGIVPVIFERINRELSGVVDVEVPFTGKLIHSRVGPHEVRCSVTRLEEALVEKESKGYKRGIDEHGRNVVTQCFLVSFTINDVDECRVPVGHPMRHRCTPPSICLNTEGSYECLCPTLDHDHSIEIPTRMLTENDGFWTHLSANEKNRSPWELSFSNSLQSSCPSRSSTYGCCEDDTGTTTSTSDTNGSKTKNAPPNESEGSKCRSSFHCPIDPCSSNSHNTCHPNAQCIRSSNPLNTPPYTCSCPEGLMGNGHKCRKGIDKDPMPKVMFDGVTPTDETRREGLYCGCTKPIVDPCAGFPKCQGKNEACTVTPNNEPICACKPGYVHVDTFGCVDESPPILQLRQDPNHDGITRLIQGDTYKEHAVDVIDDNAEDYLRSLKIAYSKPLPPGCLVDMGSFQVTYTVAMPWANPPYVRVARKVVIGDVDECKLDVGRYETQCPELIPRCDYEAGAECRNTKGSYTCQCPKYTSGDGFQFIGSIQKKDKKWIGGPEGYDGGTGCKDTSIPVIQLVGPNPKIFRTSKCMGLTGMMSSTKNVNNEKDLELLGEQRKRYEEDIAKMIMDTTAGELCATHTNQNPRPADCAKAIDHTYKGDVDISSKVTVGSPVQVSALEWKVPYNVMDDAGNAADTVWRRIVVEEVNLSEMEEIIRSEVLADQRQEVKRAVRDAVEKEKKKQSGGASYRQQKKVECPKCPKCECSTGGMGLSLAECDSLCEKKLERDEIGTCQSSEHGEYHYRSGRTLVHSFLDYFIDLTEGVLSPNFAGIVLVSVFVGFAIFMLQRILAVNQSDWQYFDPQDEEREREMAMNQVTYFNGHGRRNELRSPSFVSPSASAGGNANFDNVSGSASRPPRTSISTASGVFSTSGQQQQYTSPTGNNIYQDATRRNFQSPMSPITPATSVNQQSASRRNTPYNLRNRY